MLYFLSQLDSPDEQAAQIRRELDGRLRLAEEISRVRCSGLLLTPVPDTFRCST